MSDAAPSTDGAQAAPNANKRTPAQKAADALYIERLHLRGKGVREIAEALSKERPYTLSHQQVALDLKKLRQQWLKEAVSVVAVEKQKELRKLDLLESELWTEWDKSKVAKTRQSLRKKTRNGKGDAQSPAADEEKSAVTTSAVGDPAIARAILEVCRDRRKILGLDAPTKHEHAGPDGGPITTLNASVDGLSEEDQESLLRRHFLRMSEDEGGANGHPGTSEEAHPA